LSSIFLEIIGFFALGRQKAVFLCFFSPAALLARPKSSEAYSRSRGWHSVLSLTTFARRRSDRWAKL